jgi:hypothetical protein
MPKDTTKLSEPASLANDYDSRETVDGSSRIPTGYEGTNIPDDFSIPECTIEDVDKAVFKLFDQDLNLAITHYGKQKKVPCIFATGERFALVKRLKPIRDDDGAIILPLISVRRSGMTQSKSQSGRGQDTGDLMIKKRLDSTDRRYQQIFNKLNLANQDNVTSDLSIIDNDDPKKGAMPGRFGSREYSKSPTSSDLIPRIGSNIYEVITIPFPKFYGMTYEVTFWTQYTTHMNSLLEQTIIAYQAPGNNFKVTTDKGYWFVGYVDDEISDGTNFDDFTETERIVRYTFTLNVDAYLVANRPEGGVSPFRSFVSAPTVSFSIEGASGQVRAGSSTPNPLGASDPDSFMLEDVEILDRHAGENLWRGRKDTRVKNPYGPGYLSILSSDSRTGESIVSARVVEDLGSLTANAGEGNLTKLGNATNSFIPGASTPGDGGDS